VKVLVTGAAGLVGSHLLRSAPDDAELAATWRTTPVAASLAGRVELHRLDLCDAAATAGLLAASAPDVVVHTAYSMGSRDDVVAATAAVAAASASCGASLVHLSTDVVFDGESAPYVEADPVAPVNDYGRWKLAAERAAIDAVPDVCITRTSLVVDLALPDRSTAALLDTVRGGGAPSLFVDEVRCPIRAVDLAATLWALVTIDRRDRAGVWHLPGPEALSRWELGTRLLAAAGLSPSSVVASSALDHPEPRPADLTLRTERPTPGPLPLPVDDTADRGRG
jgi:dTDP-4-dehydrorhamnose reductase